MTNQGNNLDPWYDSYADRTAGLSASEVRALFAVASRPEVVSLAGGMPFVSALPQRAGHRARSSASCATTAPWRCSTAPARALRRSASTSSRSWPSRASGAAPTTSSSPPARSTPSTSSPACSSTPATSSSPSRPSYVGALGVFRVVPGRRRCTSRWTSDGLDPEALRETIAALEAAGKRDQVPLHDPELPQPRRRHADLGSVASRSSTSAGRTTSSCSRTTRTACSTSTSPPPQAMRSVDDDGVIYLGSFSKTLAPGLPGRLGARAARHPREAHPRQRVGHALAELVRPVRHHRVPRPDRLEGPDRHLPRHLRASAATPCSSALGEYLPDAQLDDARRRLLRLGHPARRSSTRRRMLPRAVKELVAYTPGTAFFADGQRPQQHPTVVLLPDARVDPRRQSRDSPPSSTASSICCSTFSVRR